MDKPDVRELDRAKAMDRALLMSKLFRRENFEDVIEAINEPDKKTAQKGFTVACEKAGLTDKQTTWLWNYLRNYNKDLAWNQSSVKNGW